MRNMICFVFQYSMHQLHLLTLPLETGATVSTALSVLKEHGVKEEKVYLVTLYATPKAVKMVLEAFPGITLLTSEVHTCSPSHFGQKYFGSD